MNFEIGNAGEFGVLELEGELTVSRADELRLALLRSFSCSDHIVLNLEKVTAVDLSCLQLLCSAHRTSLAVNKRITIASNRPEIFRRLIHAAGYSRHKGCVLDGDKGCLWAGGGNS